MRFTVTVDVSTDEWADEYGLDPADDTAMRADIESYLADRMWTGNTHTFRGVQVRPVRQVKGGRRVTRDDDPAETEA